LAKGKPLATRKCSIYQNTQTSINGMTLQKEDNFYLFSGKKTPKNRKNHHIWGADFFLTLKNIKKWVGSVYLILKQYK
tara:strand:- start:332 stop:565 length:234 start_codon:yes stop_codon:yes gene_type:complete